MNIGPIISENQIEDVLDRRDILELARRSARLPINRPVADRAAWPGPSSRIYGQVLTGTTRLQVAGDQGVTLLLCPRQRRGPWCTGPVGIGAAIEQ